jgi:hypothetical protein
MRPAGMYTPIVVAHHVPEGRPQEYAGEQMTWSIGEEAL